MAPLLPTTTMQTHTHAMQTHTRTAVGISRSVSRNLPLEDEVLAWKMILSRATSQNRTGYGRRETGESSELREWPRVFACSAIINPVDKRDSWRARPTIAITLRISEMYRSSPCYFFSCLALAGHRHARQHAHLRNKVFRYSTDMKPFLFTGIEFPLSLNSCTLPVARPVRLPIHQQDGGRGHPPRKLQVQVRCMVQATYMLKQPNEVYSIGRAGPQSMHQGGSGSVLAISRCMYCIVLYCTIQYNPRM